MGLDHELVLFTPIASFGLLGSLVSWFIGTDTLQRLKVNCGGMNRLRVISKASHMVSTGYPGQYSAANVTNAIDDAVCNAARVQRVELSPSTVESYLDPNADAVTNKATSMILTAFHRSNVAPTSMVASALSLVLPKPVLFAMYPFFRTPDRVFPLEDAVRRYQHNTFEPDAKPTLTAFMTPLVHEAYAPDQTKENERQAVKGRITDIKTVNETTPFLHRCMEAFLVRYIPRPHTLVPVDFDEVYDRQSRPSQRAIVSAAESMIRGTKQFIKFFVKQEAYAKPADPRIISTFNDRTKVDYSMYNYAEAEHLKAQPWYLFGLKPSEVGNAVVRCCSSAKLGVTKSDFSRFDGTISPALRDFEERSVLRKFVKSHHETLRRLVGETKNLRAVGTHGTHYTQGSARGSGSGDTSIRNSEDNAFCAFVGYKCTKINGVYLTDDEAWQKVMESLFGGDDGLLVDMDNTAYLRGCAMLGLTVKAEVVLRGKPGVVVLSRCFGPDVWFGDGNNCCDIARQLSKLHVSGVLPHGVTPIDKLVEKARSFITTDANTPILGPFCSRVVELSTGRQLNPATSGMRTWFAEEDEDARFINVHADWMDDILELQIPSFDHNVFDNFLRSIHSLEDCLSAPLCAIPKPAAPQDHVVFVDDTLLRPVGSTSTTTTAVVGTGSSKRAKRPHGGG